MEEQPTEGIRFTDRRGQSKGPAPEQLAPPVQDREELVAELRAQAEAAAAEDAAQPTGGYKCATFAILTLDRQGNMRLWSDMNEIVTELMSNGVEPDRSATSNDIINMNAQLSLVIQGNEFSARVVNALAQQAVAAAKARGVAVPGLAPNGVDPRIQQAAQQRH